MFSGAPYFRRVALSVMTMNYGFFDHKLFIQGFKSDLFCTEHIVYIVLVFLLPFLFAYLFRNVKHNRITALLRVMSVLFPILEATKITWESVYDVKYGDGFNTGGILPLYTCSLFIYTLIAAAWGKGKVREVALSFLTTISLLFGGIGVVYCNGLNYYPFWTFGAFYSLIFHSSMFATGVFLLITGYKKLGRRDIYLSVIPVFMLAVVAIPFDYILGCDYMLLYSGGGVPLYEDLASFLAEGGQRYLYTLIMLVTHFPLSALVVGLYKAVSLIVSYVKKNSPHEKRPHGKTPAVN